MVKALNICSKKFGSVVNSMSPSRRVLCLGKVINKFLPLREGRQNEETDGSLEETAGKYIQNANYTKCSNMLG